jgi:hypothetical protein
MEVLLDGASASGQIWLRPIAIREEGTSALDGFQRGDTAHVNRVLALCRACVR